MGGDVMSMNDWAKREIEIYDIKLIELDISYIAQTMAQCHITAFAGAHFDKDFAGNIIIDDNAQPSSDSPAIGVNLFTNIFAGKFPYEIIQRCAIDAGIPEKYLTDRIEKIKQRLEKLDRKLGVDKK